MGRTFTALLFAGLATTGSLYAFPMSVDIGSYAIDNYDGNGDGMVNLNFMISGGANFWWGANANVNGYWATGVGPASGTPTFALNVKNKEVNRASIMDTSSGPGGREFCDFLYYGGHGIRGSLFLGDKIGYGKVFPVELHLGVGYTRWFIANSCNMFVHPEPALIWQDAFKGLKAMLGFKSYVFDNNLSWELYNNFWTNWTYGEESLANAFFDAETNYGYAHLYPNKGLEPGCLSAEVLPGQADYCSEAFKNVTHDYARATPNTGHYYSRVIGAPQY